MTARWQHGEGQLVFARAEQLHIVAIVRTVIGHHRMEVAFEFRLTALLLQVKETLR
jgi:hypothetical protein